ncbi:hypothetical protein [Achromobacter deleyi]|uniref:hypothetical protein n=1 Tax=Achromobacter deleyi TaxID=1353891 RepID=UPI001583D56D|nr:hypothetical protein [Achromobacter deleyi]
MKRAGAMACLPLAAGFAMISGLAHSAYAAATSSVAVQPNPDTSRRIGIIATVEGAPGPFDRVDGHADYRVSNAACTPLTPVTGATVVPEQRVPVTFDRQADGTFRAEVVLAPFRDEDYFGQGVCHWALAGVVADFHRGQVDFSPAIGLADAASSRTIVKHFSNASYRNADHARIDIGADKPAAFNNPQDTFAIQLRAMPASR